MSDDEKKGRGQDEYPGYDTIVTVDPVPELDKVDNNSDHALPASKEVEEVGKSTVFEVVSVSRRLNAV